MTLYQWMIVWAVVGFVYIAIIPGRPRTRVGSLTLVVLGGPIVWITLLIIFVMGREL